MRREPYKKSDPDGGEAYAGRTYVDCALLSQISTSPMSCLLDLGGGLGLPGRNGHSLGEHDGTCVFLQSGSFDPGVHAPELGHLLALSLALVLRLRALQIGASWKIWKPGCSLFRVRLVRSCSDLLRVDDANGLFLRRQTHRCHRLSDQGLILRQDLCDSQRKRLLFVRVACGSLVGSLYHAYPIIHRLLVSGKRQVHPLI